MQPGTCHLCGQATNLVDSHIFPEFFYEGTYDESHRFISVTSHPRHKPRPMQRGITEPLLCSACDGRFGRYESYAAILFRRADAEAATASRGIALADVDFTQLRLFGMSLLWRAHVAQSHMFRAVDLGRRAEPLRRMLREGNAGEPHEYGFALAKVVGLELHGEMISAPVPAKYEGHRAYRFMARGYEWAFVVSGSARSLKEEFPFVGTHTQLYLPFLKKDKRQLFSSIRRAFPKVFEPDCPVSRVV
jgi:hypothetical protein